MPPPKLPKWPSHAHAAVALTMDNMGEAADLNRNLWPQDQPIGRHFSVTSALPQMLDLLQSHGLPATYFIESWNLHVYPDSIRAVAAAGHEVAWHAWQHEPWSKLPDEDAERANFARSFGPEGLQGHGGSAGVAQYHGFRPPGGIIHPDRTLQLCRERGLEYISPAGENAAMVPVGAHGDAIAVLPFRWRTVDAYYYMESFAGLRKAKGKWPEEPQSPECLARSMIEEIDTAIAAGDYLSVLFHPFLTSTTARLQAMRTVVEYVTQKRDSGEIWVACCRDVAAWLREHPDAVGRDPEFDLTQWR